MPSPIWAAFFILIFVVNIPRFVLEIKYAHQDNKTNKPITTTPLAKTIRNDLKDAKIVISAIRRTKEHRKWERALLREIEKIDGIEIYNPTCETGIITFNVAGVHPHDAASVFDKNDVCIRAGHHCAQPITHFLGQMSTIRASFYFYNDAEDVRKFVETVKETVEFFGQF